MGTRMFTLTRTFSENVRVFYCKNCREGRSPKNKKAGPIIWSSLLISPPQKYDSSGVVLGVMLMMLHLLDMLDDLRMFPLAGLGR